MMIDSNKLTDKKMWVRHFRQAKCGVTLSKMVDGLIAKHGGTTAVQAAIRLAECHREREIEQGRTF